MDDPAGINAVRAHLSPDHRDHPGAGCLLAAVGSDVARQPRPVRHAFTEGLRARVEALRTLMPGGSRNARREALAAMAALVGGLMLARAVDDPKLSDEILEAVSTSVARR
jgi:TetR/AcrR family transcriptional repressor of nem operon